MGFHDGAWFHCTAHHINFSHLAYYTRQIHNRTIFNTLINHNFCNSLSHQKCPLEREADQPCKQHKESVFLKKTYRSQILFYFYGLLDVSFVITLSLSTINIENGVKMTPKHHSFLSTLCFTCF